ncbi:IS5 family transposase [Chelativorans alearense]|uniref:IS5 family transposase n=1 Tax=Chelativorans alearense TaxID=2681495 RepID=UPI003CCD66B9
MSPAHAGEHGDQCRHLHHAWGHDLKPLLPNKVRGVPRVDDRRVISGIVHVLKSGCRWVDAPQEYGPRKTLYNRFVRWAAKGVWRDIFLALADAGGPPSQALIDSSAVRAHRSAAGGKGGSSCKMSRSRGGLTTKIHAITDRLCRPIRFILTGGHVPDCVAAESLLGMLPSQVDVVQGDKGYDSNAIRLQIEAAGAAPNIPPKSNRRYKPGFSPALYRDRNAVERMFGRLKDFRRIGTRYDRRADVYLSAVCLAATVSYWL